MGLADQTRLEPTAPKNPAQPENFDRGAVDERVGALAHG